MTKSKKSSRILRAIGSVLDICATENYSRYMPKGNDQKRLAQNWVAVGQYFRTATSQDDSGSSTKR